jgi:glycosyltransferase involved in cell wall biosynthesis
MADKQLSVAILSSNVGKNPEEKVVPFVFDEAHWMSQRKINVHIVRMSLESKEHVGEICFHGLERKYSIELIPFMLRHRNALPSGSLPIHPRSLLRLYLYGLSVSHVVDKDDIDVLHAEFAYPEGFVGLLAKSEEKSPLVVTLRGYDINTVSEIGYGIRLDRRLDKIVRKVLMLSDAIICVSSAIYREVHQMIGDERRLYLIHTGVDLRVFNPRNEGLEVREKLNAKDKFMILTNRHLNAVYGIQYLIRAARIVIDNNANALFVVMGCGPSLAELRSLVNDLDLNDNVKLIGAIPHLLIPKYLAACDLVVIPSLMDGLPVSGLEALASGKPLIGTNVGGLTDMIYDEVNGFLVPSKDPESLAKKILLLDRSEGLRSSMAFESRKLAEKKFDIDKNLEDVLSVYKSVA